MKFGIDSDGNYGYIKAGADSVTPFSSANLELVHTDFNANNIMDGSYNIPKNGNYLLVYQGTHNGMHDGGYNVSYNGTINTPILNSGGPNVQPAEYSNFLLTLHLFNNTKKSDVIKYYFNNWGGYAINRVFIYQIK